jgi:hypothetical protein
VLVRVAVGAEHPAISAMPRKPSIRERVRFVFEIIVSLGLDVPSGAGHVAGAVP